MSNRVSRRQHNRWAERDASAELAPAYAQAPAAPPPAAGAGEDDRIAQLKQLGDLKAQGFLTEEGFAIEKSRILSG